MSITTEATTKRDEFIAGLRDLADWYEQHPELDLPYQTTNPNVPVTFSVSVHPWTRDGKDQDVRVAFAAMVRALGGAREKAVDDNYMRVTRSFGPGLEVQVWAQRDEVCEAVVVGTEHVEVDKVITPAVTEKVTEERDVIEWRCAPVLEVAS